jgi:3,2-trans-enoyl-CoA isomerase
MVLKALPKIFTAGLDIQELYQPERGRLAEFWRSLQNFWMRLYVSPLATAAAINVSETCETHFYISNVNAVPWVK